MPRAEAPSQPAGRTIVDDVEQDDPPEAAEAGSLGLSLREAVPVGRIQTRDGGRGGRPPVRVRPGPQTSPFPLIGPGGRHSPIEGRDQVLVGYPAVVELAGANVDTILAGGITGGARSRWS
jgi:hypothetical protein